MLTLRSLRIFLNIFRYHNREALVISALQVEKHPITTPGPFTTPPPVRNIQTNNYAHLQMTPPLGLRFCSRGGSPILRSGSGGSNETYRNSPKPHSPKLKLRYMKFIFPKAEETMILDILSGNDNNIQKASEILIEMGFEKRDNAKKQSVLSKPEPAKVQHAEPDVVPAIKSVAEKKIIQSTLEEKYNDIPGQVVTIALESVNFDEHRANQILEIMVKEENDKVVPEIQTESTEDTATDLLSGTIPISQSRQSLKSLLKSEKSDYSIKGSSSFSRIIEERTDDMGGEYRSSNASLPTGANRRLAKGADQELLLEDYVKWQGPSLYQGPTKGLAKGPNPYLRQARTYQACGPNAALRKGPKFGLAKGSIFSQIKGVVSGESRGK
ncbi:uncharacterized protein LOC116173210 isoform X2 [Photinus pyralis]|uniref:uncharacterized protein LOC116173210 isoform X2 n=1 Tax=Photinus pyralis TaxID=7054 RepID=UPI00126781EF|nr:uncharacterized protein LOC116173210 isoform X2 [Photinus pyralis]